jgi:hypothetical protein
VTWTVQCAKEDIARWRIEPGRGRGDVLDAPGSWKVTPGRAAGLSPQAIAPTAGGIVRYRAMSWMPLQVPGTFGTSRHRLLDTVGHRAMSL